MKKQSQQAAHQDELWANQLAFTEQGSELVLCESEQEDGDECDPLPLEGHPQWPKDPVWVEINATDVLPADLANAPVEADPRTFVFVEETLPELKPWFKRFYAKYRRAKLLLIWVSIDHTPNVRYFAPDWWQHLREEYLAASANKRERLLEMLQEKLSGEKPNRRI